MRPFALFKRCRIRVLGSRVSECEALSPKPLSSRTLRAWYLKQWPYRYTWSWEYAREGGFQNGECVGLYRFRVSVSGF